MPTGRKQAKSRLEALLSMASGAVAEPVAGLAGLLGLATGGARRGADAVEKTRAALTYQPRDPSAMQELGRLVEPVTSRIEQGKRYLGDSAYNATGSPALAAAAYTAPEGLAAMLGLRGAGMKGPTMRQMAQRTGELPAMGSPASQIGAINAWHGSPHDFDRFSMEHIGTGDGSAARGHGLNFTDTPEVADWFRRHGGNRYEVELAPDPDDLLDLDLPLHQQPEKVKRALDDFGWAQDDMTGGEFYRALGFDYMPSPAEASRRLRELGVPGATYSGRRFEGGNPETRNYVIYDDSLVKIKGKQ